MKTGIRHICRIFVATLIFFGSSEGLVADQAKQTPLASIPIAIVNNRVLVKVSVGQHQISLTLDTGASNSALFQSRDNDFSDLLVLGDANIIFPALDEIVHGVNLVPIPIKFGAYTYRPTRLLRVDHRPPVGDRLNFKFDGVLGQDFFNEFVVEIDREAMTLNLYQAGIDLSDYFRTELQLIMKDTAPHIKLQNKMPWENHIRTKELMLDTGYPGAMVLWGDKHFLLAARGNNINTLRSENRGIFTLANFKVGMLRFFRTPIFVAPQEPIQAHQRDGIIGSNILIWFRHAIDFPRERLLLDIGSIHFNRMDNGYYLPNNENYLVKRFDPKPPVGSIYVLEN